MIPKHGKFIWAKTLPCSFRHPGLAKDLADSWDVLTGKYEKTGDASPIRGSA